MQGKQQLQQELFNPEINPLFLCHNCITAPESNFISVYTNVLDQCEQNMHAVMANSELLVSIILQASKINMNAIAWL